MTIKISELPTTDGRAQDDIIPLVQSGTTKQISVQDLINEPVFNAGEVSGTINVDLSLGKWFIFELTGDASVHFYNNLHGSVYLFWVYANGGYTISSMSVDDGSVYGKSLPNPANNAWSLYVAYAVNGDIVLTESTNYSALPDVSV